jgi:hypothetical protein
MREPTAFRTPHQRKTNPIPAVTRVASTPTTVETLIWDVIAEITEAQSVAVTTLGAGSVRGISSDKAETDITLIGSITNTSLYELNINGPTITIMQNIVFMPRKNLVNSIRLIVHIGGNLFDVRYTTSPRPSITGYFFNTMQIEIVKMYALKLTNSMLNA